MSTTKKARKPTSSGGGVGVLEPPAEASILNQVTEAAGDTLLPPETPVPERRDNAMASVWNRGQRITALWGKSETRNSWVSFRGVGWKKLSDASDIANQTLTVLAAQALQTGRNVDYREESDGMVHEIYVW